MADDIIVSPPAETGISETERLAIEQAAREAAEREAEQNRQIEQAAQLAAGSVSRQEFDSLRSYIDERIGALASAQETLASAMDALAAETLVAQEEPPVEETVVEETPPPAVSPKKRKRGWS